MLLSLISKKVDTLTYLKKSWKEYLVEFYGHPVYLFILTLASSLVFSLFSESYQRVIAVLSLGLFWVLLGALYVRFKLEAGFYKSLPGRIKYHRVVKEIEILNPEGDAYLKYSYVGENLSDTHLTGLFHILRTFDATEFLPDQIVGRVDDTPINVRVNSMAKTKKGEAAPTKYESRFTFKFPQPVPPKSPLPVHSFKVFIKGYCKGFNKSMDRTVHTIDVLTDILIFKVLVRDPLVISKWHHHVEDFHETTDVVELQRIGKEGPPRCIDEKKLVWEVKEPKITNRYILGFGLDSAAETEE